MATAMMLLGGCTNSDESISSPPPTTATIDHPADQVALAKVKLIGGPGELPEFEFTPPLSVTAPVARVVQPGSGTVVEPGNAIIVAIATVDGSDGSPQGDSYSGIPEMLMVDEENIPEALLDLLIGEQVGARLLYAEPATQDVTVMHAFEILLVLPVLEQAEGKAAAPVDGLPVVTVDADGHPTLEPIDGPPPTELVAQPLIVGEGERMLADSWLVLHETSWLWDGTSLSSSRDIGAPRVLLLTDALDGWQQGLEGQTVGSRMLLIVPPELALGDEAADDIPAGSTLVSVVDILAGI